MRCVLLIAGREQIGDNGGIYGNHSVLNTAVLCVPPTNNFT